MLTFDKNTEPGLTACVVPGCTALEMLKNTEPGLTAGACQLMWIFVGMGTKEEQHHRTKEACGKSISFAEGGYPNYINTPA